MCRCLCFDLGVENGLSQKETRQFAMSCSDAHYSRDKALSTHAPPHPEPHRFALREGATGGVPVRDSDLAQLVGRTNGEQPWL